MPGIAMDRATPFPWTPRSPDLNPLDFVFCGGLLRI